MKNYKFGRKQIGNPTPAKIGFAVLLISAIGGGIQVWLGTAGYIPSKVSEVLQSILGLIIMLSNILRPFFGVNLPTSTDSVPVENVTEVETDPDKK